MERSIPEFVRGATNVYRTDCYIVRQQVKLLYDKQYGSYLFSRDTYYPCTPRRDAEYEEIFSDRRNVNGKRMRTAMYSRTYAD